MKIVHNPSVEELAYAYSKPLKVSGFVSGEGHLQAMEDVPKGSVYFLHCGKGYLSDGKKFLALPDNWMFGMSPRDDRRTFSTAGGSFYPDILSRYRCLLSCAEEFNNGEFDNTKHLLWMLCQLEFNKDQSLTKKHRWLGYIQHALISAGLTDVMTERDLTRSIFNGE